MLILQILMIIAAIIILFVVFIPNKIEFRFAGDFWEFRFQNLFFKYSSNAKNSEKKSDEEKIAAADNGRSESEGFDESFAKTYKATATNDVADKHEYKAESEIKSEADGKIEPETKVEIEALLDTKNNVESGTEIKIENAVKAESEKKYKPEIDGDDNEYNAEEPSFNFFTFVKNFWEKEEALVISLLKFIVKTVKLSLKLLTPSKIEFNFSGGFYDPAETGWLYSLFMVFKSFFENGKRIDISFEPCFYKEKWKFDGSASYVFSIAKFLLFALAVFFFIPWLRIFAALWRNRKNIFGKKK